MLRLIVTAAAFAAATAALAQTAEIIAACTPDAIRLCHPTAADAADHRRIIACMKRNRKELSAECRRAALAHH